MSAGPGTVWQKRQPIPMAPPQWVQVGNVVGPAGVAGAAGQVGAQGPIGPAGPGSLGGPLNQAYGIVPSAQNNSTTSPQNLPGMSFPIQPNEVWTAEFYIVGSASAGPNDGIQFQCSGPASPNRVTMFTQGTMSGVTALSHDFVTAFNTLGQAYGTAAGSIFATIRLEIENGPNAGIVQLQFSAETSTNQVSVGRGSYMNARRIA